VRCSPAARLSRASSCFTLAASLLLAACGGDSTGPGGVTTPPAEPVAMGDTVGATLSVTEATRTYIFHATVTDTVVLFGQATGGYVLLTVTDSVSDEDIGGLGLDGTTSRPLLVTFTKFGATAGAAYLIRVRGATPGVGSFRFALTSFPRAPESRPVAVTIGVVEEGEALATGADVDEFVLTGSAGDELIGYFQPLDGQPLNSMVFAVFDEGNPLAAAINRTASSDLQGLSTQRFVLPHDGSYRVVVRGEYGWTLPGRPDAGRYRFELFPIQRAPEQLTPPIPAGDTIAGETLDYVGDVDEFVFAATAGRLYNVFLQDLSDSASHVIAAEVAYGNQDLVGTPAEGGVSLFRRGTGRFTAANTGPYTVRVHGNSDGDVRGPYRLFVYAIDTLPEVQSATLAPGGTLSGEALDLPGDIDEFTMTLAADTTVNIALLKSATDSVRPTLYVPNAAGDAVMTIYNPLEPGGPGELVRLSGSMRLAAGTYRFRVDGGAGVRDETPGPFRVQSWGLDARPEGVPETIAVGGAVDEASAPAGDVDRYRFTGTKGQLVNVVLRGTGTPGPGGGLVAYLERSGIEGSSLIALAGTNFGSPPPGGQTGLVQLPADGDYDIRVFPNGNGEGPTETGPYHLSLIAVDPRPELVAATLPASGGIVGEAIDTTGDIDRFTVTAAPGSEFEILGRLSSPGVNMIIETLLPTGDAPDRSRWISNYDAPLGRFLVPASGQLRLQLHEFRYGFNDEYAGTGGYTVTFVPINRAPERISAGVSRNVVVQGESLTPIGDVDEFTLNGVAGEQVQAYFNTPQGVITGGTLTLEVVEAATQIVLGTVESGNPTPEITDQGTGLLTLPSTGAYRIRVRGTLDTTGAAPYEFLIAD
jgi:hypothetical protein